MSYENLLRFFFEHETERSVDQQDATFVNDSAIQPSQLAWNRAGP